MLKTALSITSQIDGLKQSSDGAASDAQPLILGGSHGPSASLLPTLIAQFRKTHPRAELTLHTGTSLQLQNLLLHSKLDLAVVIDPAPIRSLHREPFRVQRLAAFVPGRHPLAGQRIVKPGEFVKYPLVIKTGGSGRSRSEEILDQLKLSQLQLKPYLRCESPEALKMAVRRGAGIGLLYETVIEDEVRRGEFRVLKIPGIDLTAISYLVYSNQRPLSPIAAEFIALLREFRDRSGSIKHKTSRLRPALSLTS